MNDKQMCRSPKAAPASAAAAAIKRRATKGYVCKCECVCVCHLHTHSMICETNAEQNMFAVDFFLFCQEKRNGATFLLL